MILKWGQPWGIVTIISLKLGYTFENVGNIFALYLCDISQLGRYRQSFRHVQGTTPVSKQKSVTSISLFKKVVKTVSEWVIISALLKVGEAFQCLCEKQIFFTHGQAMLYHVYIV